MVVLIERPLVISIFFASLAFSLICVCQHKQESLLLAFCYGRLPTLSLSAVTPLVGTVTHLCLHWADDRVTLVGSIETFFPSTHTHLLLQMRLLFCSVVFCTTLFSIFVSHSFACRQSDLLCVCPQSVQNKLTDFALFLLKKEQNCCSGDNCCFGTSNEHCFLVN